MKQQFALFVTSMLMIGVVTNCNEPDTFVPKEENKEFGYLSLQLALQIDQLPAGRLKVVNTDDFLVTIHDATNGSEVKRFDPFSSAPAEIELPTGEYFVRATNLEPPANAEFEQPWYFGESVVFNIDKEEIKTIDVTCVLANFKVSFVYSQNVVDNFTDWNATATLINEGDFLFWPMGDDREGYFITSPLDINVYLEYTKVFTGELITRNFVTTIDDPQPATHYRINIDASLEDGKIVIDITVDESFDVIDIDLGDNNLPSSSGTNCLSILTANPSAADGVYTIDPDGDGGNDPYDCFCDMTTDGGGWTLVWSKTYGSVNHPVTNITWDNALNRIPQETVDVYTGLNIWNQIIGDQPEGEFMYRWDLEDGTPAQSFKATIQKFNPNDNYTIRLTNYQQLLGSVQPGLWYNHNNMPFSTFDRDNDLWSSNCSTNYGNTAFWYNTCWDGNFWGWGEVDELDGNGSYWVSFSFSAATTGGQGHGNGNLFVK